jgi:DNA-binding NarL/FixJ family response regulator
VIRTLIVDDHPAVLNGLVAALRGEPGIVPVATATGSSDALRQVERNRPDVLLLDYQLTDGDGLSLAHELKRLPKPPAVLIYSGFAGPALGLAARVAGVDGMVNKDASLEDLFAAIRTLVRGGTVLPPLRPAALEASVTKLDPEDLPILAMRTDGATPVEIATVLRVDEHEVSRRMLAMIRRLAEPLDPRVHARLA